MGTNADHVLFAEDAADHHRQLILAVSGNVSLQIVECLDSGVGTDYIGGSTTL